MSTQQHIKAALDRVVSVLKSRPSQGFSVKSAQCEIVDGLVAECRAGDFSFTADMSKALGGTGSAPSPGAYARAGLASCLAIGYAMIFAQRQLPVGGIRVKVDSESDARGYFALDDVLAGFQKLVYSVEVDSAADPAEIRDAIDEADRNSSVLRSFANPVPVERQLQVNQIEAVGEPASAQGEIAVN
jgi:uncharacterized OsmC-like protein